MPDSLPVNVPTRPIWIKVHTPYGPINLNNVEVGESVNRGREWSFTTPSYLDPYFGDVAPVFLIQIYDSINHYITPELTITDAKKSRSMEGQSSTFSGIDMTTWTMTESDMVLGTYVKDTSTGIIKKVASKLGIKVSGVEQYNVVNEDANNQKMLEILTRIIDKSGQNWIINSDGSVQVLSNMYIGVKSDMLISSFSKSTSYSSKVDSLKIGKTSRTSGGAVTGDENCFRFDSIGFKSGQFKQPLYNAVPYDRSLSGFVYYVTTFNGSISTGTVTGRYKMVFDGTIITGGPIDVSLPSTHFTCVINLREDLPRDTPIDAKVCFTGRPTEIVANEEPTFLVQFGLPRATAPGPRTRPYKYVKIDTLYPSKAFVLAHAQNYLLEHNRNFVRCEASGPLDLSVGLFQTHHAYNCDEFVIDSYKHSISIPDNATTNISGIPKSIYEWCIANKNEIAIQDS